MFEQDLRASGMVRAVAGAVNRLLDEVAGQPVDRARQAVRDTILLRVADARAARVLAALAVGGRTGVGTGRSPGRRAAQPGALGAAPRQQDLVERGLHQRGGAGHGLGAGRPHRSRFGHPAPEVPARYRALGVELVRSDACGAWSWGAQGVARCQRETATRYWHHRVDGGQAAGR